VPLISMYSAMRIEEICQLSLSDIRMERSGDGAVWVFDVNNQDGRKVKTLHSRRLVHMHRELEALGLLQYVNKLRQQGATRLFPDLNKLRDGYSQTASKWFGRWRRTIGIEKDFHSLRHTVATKLRDAGVPLDLISDILGHSRSDNETGRYAKAASVLRKLDALKKLTY
jgi:integrase